MSLPFITGAIGSLALATGVPVISIATALRFEVAISMPINTDYLAKGGSKNRRLRYWYLQLL